VGRQTHGPSHAPGGREDHAGESAGGRAGAPDRGGRATGGREGQPAASAALGGGGARGGGGATEVGGGEQGRRREGRRPSARGRQGASAGERGAGTAGEGAQGAASGAAARRERLVGGALSGQAWRETPADLHRMRRGGAGLPSEQIPRGTGTAQPNPRRSAAA